MMVIMLQNEQHTSLIVMRLSFSQIRDCHSHTGKDCLSHRYEIAILRGQSLSLRDFHSHRYPWHASCSVEWSFSSPCDRVSNLLETQMKVNCQVFHTCNQNQLQHLPTEPWKAIHSVKTKDTDSISICPN